MKEEQQSKLLGFIPWLLTLRYVDGGGLYLQRWGWSWKWFGIYIHKLHAPDPEAHVHNHPWNAIVVILSWFTGGYVQQAMKDGYWYKTRYVGMFNLLGGSYHKIVYVKRPVWTLLIRGPITRNWGYWAPNVLDFSKPYRHIGWKAYKEAWGDKVIAYGPQAQCREERKTLDRDDNDT